MGIILHISAHRPTVHITKETTANTELGGHRRQWVNKHRRLLSRRNVKWPGAVQQNEFYALNIDNLFYPWYKDDLELIVHWSTGWGRSQDLHLQTVQEDGLCPESSEIQGVWGKPRLPGHLRDPRSGQASSAKLCMTFRVTGLPNLWYHKSFQPLQSFFSF